MHFKRVAQWVIDAVVAALLLASVVQFIQIVESSVRAAQSDSKAFPPQVKFTGDGDHKNMMAC